MSDWKRCRMEMNVLVTPDMANFSGRMHGGDLLKILDQVAYTCSARYSGYYPVTLSVDKVTFNEPIYIGELLTFMSTINYTGRSSMEVGIKVIAEDIKTKVVRHTNTCFITMVALDEDGKPVQVPEIALKTEDSQRRYKAAKRRKKLSIKAAKSKHEDE